jgi:pimeloyl-ACP methyl ester carboxylesterase
VGSGRSLTTIERARKSAANPPHDPWPVDHEFLHAPYEPWTTARAYEHTLVSGNDGELVVTDFTRPRSEADRLAQEIVHEAPRRWFAHRPGTPRLLVYAHGGLNGEDESIKRIRVLAPYFEANGIYPLFLTWKTGAGEALCHMVEDWGRKVFPEEAMRAAGVLSEARDRAVEAVARTLGRGIWTEMRENAALGQVDGHGLDLAARNLASLAQALRSDGRRLELHLVGHSAGAILLGHLLTRLGDIAHAPRIASATLFAPACSTRFAVDHYLAAANRGQLALQALRLHVLSDENERGDGLPSPGLAAYGKSLLYLVSRALDDQRKMPLLGMARALDPAYANDGSQWAAGELETVQRWQAAFPSANVHLVSDRDVRNTRSGAQVPATHGSFDNNIDVLTAVIERIKGGKIPPMEWLDY